MSEQPCALSLELLTTDGGARRGRVTTARGTFETPVFMAVGTRGVISHLEAADYRRVGLEVVLANTYHLMARPGAEVVQAAGGIGQFCGWDGHTLTDSGGYQVMSLARHRKIDDDGVTFRSTYDGAELRLTPESAVAAQEAIGADIQMALDHCPALPASEQVVRAAAERTHHWAARAKAAHSRTDQALFGISQGGTDHQLRRQSAEFVAELGFDGYGIGGLSVGEAQRDTLGALAAATDVLPAGKPRYLMGVGDPVSIVDAIGAGVDMFDCVLPTRLGRHATALTDEGKLNLRNRRFARDHSPLQAGTPIGGGVSRAFLRHLFTVREPSAARTLTLHNLWYLTDLVSRARQAIEAGVFNQFAATIRATWSGQ